MKKQDHEKNDLPPNQIPIPSILRWGIDHPGISRSLPKVAKEDWRLIIDGEVDNSLTFSLNDFLKLPQIESESDFHCVEGWSVMKQKWGGVRFLEIVNLANPKKTVEYVLFTCYDDYTTSLPLSVLMGGDILLANKLNGEELSQPLGGPVRLIVPQKYAYKSAMWVSRITFLIRDRLGYWERGGYSNTADPWKNDRYKFI